MTALLPTPPNFQRIAWHGITLLLPNDWNLRLHHGNYKSGALLFTDLHAPRLELRWRTPRRTPLFQSTPQHSLEKTLTLLQKRRPASKVERLSPSAARIINNQDTLLLAADATRLYELHWPPQKKSPENHLTPITTDFLHHLTLPTAPDHFWSIYGATGHVPARAKLKKISLLPGATTLTFRHRSTTITLGSFSMADRLLAQSGSLRNWAATSIPLIARFSKATWQESPQETQFTVATKYHLRPYRHHLRLRHDPTTNRITWTHHFAPGHQHRPSEP